MSDPAHPMIPEELLEHAPWVRRLAWQLLHDADLVDDAMQHTWLAAMRSPPKKSEKIRAWFRAVLNNFARDTYRSESARVARERVAARAEAVPAADEVFERAMCHREVVSAVLALDEPSRTVLLLRYFDDLPPRKIAARLELPVETVRTRIKRALTRLRGRLQSDAGRDGRDWKAVLVPLVATPGGSGGSTRPFRRVATRWGLAAGAAVVLVAAVLAARHDSTPPARELDSADARRSADAKTTPLAAPSRATRRAKDGETAVARATDLSKGTDAPATPLTVGRVEIRGRLLAEGVAASAEIHLRVTPITADARAALEPRVLIASPGEFASSFEPWSAPGTEIVAVDVVPDHPDFLPARTRVPWPVDRSKASLQLPPITLRRAAIITGAVPREGNEAPLVVAIFLRRTPNDRFEMIDECRAGVDGAFRLRMEPGLEHLLVALAPGRPPSSRWVRSNPGADTNVGALAVEPGVTCSGRVMAAPEISLAGALVEVNARTAGRSIPYPGENLALDEDSVVMREFSKTRLGADGQFSFAGLAPGPYRIEVGVQGLAGDLQQALAQDIDLPHPPVTIALVGAVTDLEVAGPYGPVERAKVLIRAGASATASSGSVTAAAPSPQSSAVAPLVFVRTDTNGHARLIGEPGHAYELSIECPGYETAAVSVALSATPTTPSVPRVRTERVDLRPLPTDARWNVTINSKAALDSTPPAAPEHVAIAFFKSDAPDSPTPLFVRNTEITNGALHVDGIPAGSYRVVVRAGTTWEASRGYFVDAVRTVDFAPSAVVSGSVALVSGGRLRLTATSADGSGLSARVQVRDAQGSLVPVWLTHREVGQRYDSPDELTAAGPVEVSSALAPGIYTVHFALPGHSPVHRNVRIEAGASADVVVTLSHD